MCPPVEMNFEDQDSLLQFLREEGQQEIEWPV
jgi:hypothetical protein